jgi:subtilase family serine protease
MAHLRSLSLLIVASALLFCSALMAQGVAPAVRIVERVDASRLVTLKGNTHPYARTANDRGRVSADLPMTDLILVLSRDAAQQASFDAFVASQYETGSANYHHWLTAEEVGEMFGPAASDLAAVTSWLTGNGFSVDEVSKDRMSIRFSGTAGQVESAFHTEIHNLAAMGEQHIGNMTDPQIPAALTPAVVGVKALHNFFAKPQHRTGGQAMLNHETGKWQRVASISASSSGSGSLAAPAVAHPEFGITVGSGSSAYLVEDVTPYDFAKIYNVLPLWTASTPIDGTGQTIAIAGTSSIVQSDVTSFRTLFGLPTGGAANTPKLVSGNSMPVTVCSGTSTTTPYSGNYCNLDDQTENALDTEWSGAVAKGAQIVLVSSYPASASDDGLYDSESYIVNNLTARIMNVSYGECELGMGTAGNAQYNTLWQTAAAEGIAVFVSSGDEGSASCDAGMDTNTPYAAQLGLSVSGMASTPYNTAVGGTDLNWGSTASPYWGTSNSSNGSNALGYMPEVPWNDTCTNPLALSYLQEWATTLRNNGYNATSPTDAETACNFVVNWWSTIYRNTNPTVDISSFVDITGGSGGVSACTTSNGSTVASCSGGYAKPSWQTGVAGIPSDGKRDIPDVSFFASNGFLGSAYLICVSANGTCVSSTTTTTEPTTQEIGGTSASSPAMAGVMALINQKAGAAQGSPNAQLYTLAAQQTYSSCKTESATTSSSCYFNDIDTGTIAVPCMTGSPNCTVLYSGDQAGLLAGYGASTGYDLATGLGSLNVANVVNAWPVGAPTATFALSATNVSLIPGATTGNTTTVGVTPLNGFTGTVSLQCAVTTSPTSATNPVTCNIPSSASLSAATPVSKTLTISSTNTTTGGTYVVTVTGTSGNITETVLVTVTMATPSSGIGSFALTNSGNITVSRGATTGNTATISVTPSGGFTGTVSLSCAITPTAASDPMTCSIPTSVAVGSTAAQTATLTVSTTAASTALNQTRKLFWPSAGGAALALVFLFGIPARRRKWLSMLGLLLLVVSVAGIGCGGGSSSGSGGSTSNPGTTAGTYAVTVTGTSGSITQTTIVNVTVN